AGPRAARLPGGPVRGDHGRLRLPRRPATDADQAAQPPTVRRGRAPRPLVAHRGDRSCRRRRYDRPPVDYPVETFTDAERARLRAHVTNLDRPVFALINLPETVKGALFARYSRYP